jgi:catechol 2,3-dioxygenase-like lactoylglutathione lyase family enzyme
MEILNTNVTINVKNINDSVKFYEKIGFSLKQRWDNHYAQLSAPGIELGLHPSDVSLGLSNREGISIGFTTKDFEKTKNELSKLEISVTERSEEGGDFLHFNDPDGTSLYFIRSNW